MSKRRLSSPSLLPAKRLHLNEDGIHAPSVLISEAPRPLLSSLYDELILSIFSHLSWKDLCAAQATSRSWSRLAADNELWRKLYLRTFGRSRLRGGRGLPRRPSGGDPKSLPVQADGGEVRDWKWMFRISSNWRKGRSVAERLHTQPLEAAQPSHRTRVLLTGTLIIYASSQPSTSPWICLSGVGDVCHKLHCATSEPGLYHITALTQDQSHPSSTCTRVAAFLQNGEVSIFHVDHSNPALSHLQMTYTPTRRLLRASSISQAAYHHPILVTLSDSFNLSIYDLSSGSARHSQTLTSYTSYPPTSLVLSTPTPDAYKLVLAYSVPVYPRHWTVGITELIISGPVPTTSSPLSTSPLSSQTPLAPPISVTSTRTIRAVDIPQGWMDENKLRVMQEQWSRKVARVLDTQSDGKWVIMAPADLDFPTTPSSSPPLHGNLGALSSYSPTSLQLYRLSLPSLSPSVSAPRPKLTFVRNLHGHTSPVSSLAVADGRCVSLGIDGSIWIWDLETGTSTEVPRSSLDLADIAGDTNFAKGTVVFDWKRIVTAQGSDVMIRRFDV